MTRIAIIDKDKCKPEKCAKECMKYCPPQRSGKRVIDIEDTGKSLSDIDKSQMLVYEENKTRKVAKISENLCIGCNQCVKVCPFGAIKIVNIPEENPNDIVHRYSPNAFRLYKLPIMKPNTIIGIIGENGVGKTTLIDILSNKIRPNFEQYNKSLTDKEIISKFRGTVLQDYLKELYSYKLCFSIKEQRVKNSLINIPKTYTVREFIEHNYLDMKKISKLDSFEYLEIDKLLDFNVHTLSGGELQRLLCWKTAVTNADVYLFDEPSNYLDIKQRLEISRLIKSIQDSGKYVIVIEHDLSILDYICDEIYIVYGQPGVYGIVSKPLSTLEGINMYLDGYITTQNIRFREEEFNLKPISDTLLIINEVKYEVKYELDYESKELDKELDNGYDNGYDKVREINKFNKDDIPRIQYPSSSVKYDKFELTIPSGRIEMDNNIVVVMGENGTGKTTFINWIAKNNGKSVSMKEQSVNIKKYEKYGTVSELIHKKIRTMYYDPLFQTDVVKKLNIEPLESRHLNELSGGELQRVMILICLGTPADIYLLDEPSANLDIDYRLKVIKIIKRFIINNKKMSFIIEHDIMMSVAFAQEIGSKILIVKETDNKKNENKNGIKYCTVSDYYDFHNGINNVLKLMNITMRISSHNRPRINKCNSQLEQEQKRNGNYYGL